MTGHQNSEGRFHEAALCVSNCSHQTSHQKVAEETLAKRQLCAYPKSCLVDRLWVPITVFRQRAQVVQVWRQRHRIYSRPGLSDSVAKQVEGEKPRSAAVRRSRLCVAGIAGVIVAKYQ